jgi:DNA modification methylase
MGYASTGKAAIELKRKFTGIEIGQVRYNDAYHRLSELKACIRANKKC